MVRAEFDDQPRVIDLHAHILPGLDDGPRTPAGSVAMARAAVADGIRLVAATPHVRDDWPTAPEEMERGVEELRGELAEAGVPLELRTGGEVALEQLAGRPVEELRRFGLGGNPDYLLVETPYSGWPPWLGDVVLRLCAAGVTPVLAHPERNREVQEQPERLLPLVRSGALVQLTAASLDGRLGRRSRAASFRLLELGLAHLLASDAHEPRIRAIGLSAAVVALGDERLARWLTVDVPSAIVEATPLPPAPN